MTTPGWNRFPGANNPSYLDTDSPDKGSGKSSGTLWVVVGLLVLTSIIVAFILIPRSQDNISSLEDTRSDRPAVEPWDELSDSPNPDPQPQPENNRPQNCPDVGFPHSDVGFDGRLHGGGLSVVAPSGPGWVGGTTYMPWMNEQNSVIREVKPGWIASVDIGSVRPSDGFTDPKQATHGILSCMASSWLYADFVNYTVLSEGDWSLAGKHGWHLKVNVYVDRTDGILGDVLDIFVIDLGQQDQLSVLVGTATIDHRSSIEDVDASLQTVQIG